jgi:hypothetical protein
VFFAMACWHLIMSQTSLKIAGAANAAEVGRQLGAGLHTEPVEPRQVRINVPPSSAGHTCDVSASRLPRI